MNAAQGVTEISIYFLIFQSAGAEDFKNEGLFGNKILFLVLYASMSSQAGYE